MNAKLSLALIAGFCCVLECRALHADTVNVTPLYAGDQRSGFRIQTETDHSAETLDIDTAAGEMRGFGFIFHVEYDNSGAPVALRVSNGIDAAEVTGDGNVDSPHAASRLRKQFVDSNGPQRVHELKGLLETYLAQHGGRHGRIGTNDILGCIMDLVAITIDWIAVVSACGAPVVDIFACGPAILWATADTVREASDAATDCAP